MCCTALLRMKRTFFWIHVTPTLAWQISYDPEDAHGNIFHVNTHGPSYVASSLHAIVGVLNRTYGASLGLWTVPRLLQNSYVGGSCMEQAILEYGNNLVAQPPPLPSAPHAALAGPNTPPSAPPTALDGPSAPRAMTGSLSLHISDSDDEVTQTVVVSAVDDVVDLCDDEVTQTVMGSAGDNVADPDLCDDAMSTDVPPTEVVGDGAEEEEVGDLTGKIIFNGWLDLIVAECQRAKTSWMAMRIMTRYHGPNVNILFVSANFMNHTYKVASSFKAQSGGLEYFVLNSKTDVHYDTIRRHVTRDPSLQTPPICRIFTLANDNQLDKMADVMKSSFHWGQKWIIICDEADLVLPIVHKNEHMGPLIASDPSRVKVVGITATIPVGDRGWLELCGKALSVYVRAYVPKSPHYTKLSDMGRRFVEQARDGIIEEEVLKMVGTAMSERTDQSCPLNIFIPYKNRNEDHSKMREKLLERYPDAYALVINQDGYNMWAAEGVIGRHTTAKMNPRKWKDLTGENEYDAIKGLYEIADSHAGRRADVFIIGRTMVKRCITIHGEGRVLTHVVASRYLYVTDTKNAEEEDKRANEVYQFFARACGSFPMPVPPVILYTSLALVQQALERELVSSAQVRPEGHLIERKDLVEALCEANAKVKTWEYPTHSPTVQHTTANTNAAASAPAPAPRRRTRSESGAPAQGPPTTRARTGIKEYPPMDLSGTLAEMWKAITDRLPPSMTRADREHLKSGVVNFRVRHSATNMTSLRIITKIDSRRKLYFDVEYDVNTHAVRMVPYTGDVEALRTALHGETSMDILKDFLVTFGHEYKGDVYTYCDLDTKLRERMCVRYHAFQQRNPSCRNGILYGANVAKYAMLPAALIEPVSGSSPAMYRIK